MWVKKYKVAESFTIRIWSTNLVPLKTLLSVLSLPFKKMDEFFIHIERAMAMERELSAGATLLCHVAGTDFSVESPEAGGQGLSWTACHRSAT